jgi:hypothetical protein
MMGSGFFIVVLQGEVKGKRQPARAAEFGFDPRTEDCSQAFGVLRPTMVLSASVQSQIGAVSSASSSNLGIFGHPCVLQALTGSPGTLNQTFRFAQRRLLNDSIPSRMFAGARRGGS